MNPSDDSSGPSAQDIVKEIEGLVRNTLMTREAVDRIKSLLQTLLHQQVSLKQRLVDSQELNRSYRGILECFATVSAPFLLATQNMNSMMNQETPLDLSVKSSSSIASVSGHAIPVEGSQPVVAVNQNKGQESGQNQSSVKGLGNKKTKKQVMTSSPVSAASSKSASGQTVYIKIFSSSRHPDLHECPVGWIPKECLKDSVKIDKRTKIEVVSKACPNECGSSFCLTKNWLSNMSKHLDNFCPATKNLRKKREYQQDDSNDEDTTRSHDYVWPQEKKMRFSKKSTQDDHLSSYFLSPAASPSNETDSSQGSSPTLNQGPNRSLMALKTVAEMTWKETEVHANAFPDSSFASGSTATSSSSSSSSSSEDLGLLVKEIADNRQRRVDEDSSDSSDN